MKLGVLDQSPISEGDTAAGAIAETLALAQACDRLGYHRYWLAEHHNAVGLAGSAPEILIARVAGLTRHMRIGAGGVMVNHYSALKVAECFRMLETLYPGRIDLGLGRAPGSDRPTARALSPTGAVLDIAGFEGRVGAVLDFLADAPRDDGVRAEPRGPGLPEVWMLGASDRTAGIAARLGLPFCFAHFITERQGPEIMAAYRRDFQASHPGRTPRSALAVFAIAANSDAEAERLAMSRDLWLLRLQTGLPGPVPSPDAAATAAARFTPPQAAVVRAARRRLVAGAGPAVAARLRTLAQQHVTGAKPRAVKPFRCSVV